MLTHYVPAFYVLKRRLSRRRSSPSSPLLDPAWLQRFSTQDKVKNVTPGDDADHLTFLHYGKGSNPVATQKFHSSREGSRGTDSKHIVAHHLVHRVGVGEAINLLESVDNQAGGIGVAEVPICDDPDKLSVIENRQLVDSAFRHDPPGIADAIDNGYGSHWPRHTVRNPDH